MHQLKRSHVMRDRYTSRPKALQRLSVVKKISLKISLSRFLHSAIPLLAIPLLPLQVPSQRAN